VEGSSKDHDESEAVSEEDGSQDGSEAPHEGSEEYASEEEDREDLGKTVKTLSGDALADFEKAKQKAGIIYISRIPPGMRPAKVKHLMSNYGKVGRVFLQQEGEHTPIFNQKRYLKQAVIKIPNGHIFERNTLLRRRYITPRVGLSLSRSMLRGP
jgi:ESF2/ABP1 family protein